MESVKYPRNIEGTSPTIKQKGRGFRSKSKESRDRTMSNDKYDQFESPANDDATVEGWILLITGLHEETTESEITEKFSDYGRIKNLHLNLDQRTGFIKGYALVEYETFKEANNAIDAINGTKLLGSTLGCGFAFVKSA